VAAAVTLPLGLTRGKEYAELIWPINSVVAAIWVVFAVNFFWTLARRNEPSLYVAIWFYIATIITVAMLYIVNHLSLPTSLLHSYPVFGGVQDALVQWWYGHNAVAFFLTTPILGIMYYFVPKAAERPIYSYRLSFSALSGCSLSASGCSVTACSTCSACLPPSSARFSRSRITRRAPGSGVIGTTVCS